MSNDIPVNIRISAVNEAQSILSGLNSNIASLKNSMQSLNTENNNSQSFFSQSTMALMSGTGQMIKGIGDQMSGFVSQIRNSRSATESARNGLASMGTSVEDLDKMELTAKTVGEQFGIMKSEILDAAYALKGGMSYVTADTLNELMGLGVQLGAATKSSSNTISNLLANAGNTIGANLQGDAKKFKEFQYQFANSAAAVVNIGKAEGDQVAAFTKNIGSGLQSLDQDLATQQALATVLITTAGSGERAATMVTSGLTKKWTTYMKGLEKVGIKTVDSSGKIRSMIPVLAELKEKVAGMGSIEKQNFMKNIFGSAKSGNVDMYTKKAIDSLMDNSAMLTDTYSKMGKAIEEGTAAANGEIELSATMMGQMAQAFQQGPAFVMEQMKVKQQNLMESTASLMKQSVSPIISLKSKLMDLAQVAIDSRSPLIGTFLNLTEQLGMGISAAGGFMTQIGGIGRGLSSLKLFKDTLSGWFGKKKDNTPLIPKMPSSRIKLGVDGDSRPFITKIKQQLQSSVKNAIQTGIAKVKAPVIAIQTKINNAVAGTAFGKVTSTIGNGLKSVPWAKIGGGIMKGLGIAGAIGGLLLPFAMKDKTLGPQIQQMMKDVQNMIGPLIKDLMTSLQPLMPVIKDSFGRIVKALMPIVPVLIKAVAPLLPPLVQLVTTIVDAIAPFIPDLVSFISEIIQMVMPMVTMIFNLLKPVIPIIMGLVKMLMPLVKFLFSVLGGILKGVIRLLPDAMLSQDMKVQKYLELAQERKAAGQTGNAMAAQMQAIAYASNLDYGKFAESLQAAPDAVQVSVRNLLQNDKYQALINSGKSEDIMAAKDMMMKTMREGEAGNAYDKNGKLLTKEQIGAQAVLAKQDLALIFNESLKNTKGMDAEGLQNSVAMVTNAGYKGVGSAQTSADIQANRNLQQAAYAGQEQYTAAKVADSSRQVAAQFAPQDNSTNNYNITVQSAEEVGTIQSSINSDKNQQNINNMQKWWGNLAGRQFAGGA